MPMRRHTLCFDATVGLTNQGALVALSSARRKLAVKSLSTSHLSA